MSLESTFNGLPAWAKGGIAVGTLALTAIVGFSIYNKVKKTIALKKERQSGRDIETEIHELKKEGASPTLTQAQISSMADGLKQALTGTLLTTDETAIYNILNRVKNKADLLQLIKTFGIREIGYGFNKTKGTLTELIIDQVPQSSMWRKSVNDINEMLTKKGINFSF